MKISLTKIKKDIKKEYKLARKFCDFDKFSRYYTMMIDTDSGSIWSDCFINGNTWKEYHDDSIQQLDYIPGYVKDTEQGYIDSAVKLLTDAGREVIE